MPQQIVTSAAFDEIRERYAMLRAFQRRLGVLLAESTASLQRARENLAELDARHPTHRTEYRTNYERALRESGIEPSTAPLMRYLEADD